MKKTPIKILKNNLIFKIKITQLYSMNIIKLFLKMFFHLDRNFHRDRCG